MPAVDPAFLAFLVRWFVSAGALYAVLHGRFTSEREVLGALGGGIFVAAGWGTFRLLALIRAKIQLLLRSKSGLIPEDGKPFVAAGRILPRGEPLTTPFRKQKCVAFAYSIYERIVVTTRNGSSVTTQQRKKPHMGGLAVCPCAVHASNTSIKILGFPLLDAFPLDAFPAAEHGDEILAYIKIRGVPVGRALSLRQLLYRMRLMIMDGESIHRHEWRDAKLERRLSHPSTYVEERLIPVKSQVCVFGNYSSAQKGLLPEADKAGLEVLLGTVDDAIHELQRRHSIFRVVAIVCLTIGTFGVYAALSWF